VSALANKYGFRIVTMAGAAIAGGGLFASSYAGSITELLIFCGILGGEIPCPYQRNGHFLSAIK